MTDEKRMQFLENAWAPEASFSFPGSGKRNLKFQYKWFSRWNWLVYSKKMDGAFCKYCCLFHTETAGKGSHQAVGKLVREPYCRWKDAVENFNLHQKSSYHQDNVLKALNFSRVYTGTQGSVELQLDSAVRDLIMRNRTILSSIIKTVIFCGRQCLPLRGHRDDGPFNFDKMVTENEGVFRALIRFRIEAGDTQLKKHLDYGPKNAQYLSPIIQNEIIAICNEIILKKLVASVNSAKCFTVLADETTDISQTEQVSIAVRYVDEMEYKIKEVFLQFVPVIDTSGKNLAEVIESSLINFGLNMDYLRGQGYDGAAAMKGKFQGVQAHLKRKYPLAIYTHCVMHSLNLAISDACQITPIRNFNGIASKICAFFNTPKRLSILQNSIVEIFPESKATRLKSVCPTRWIERHDATILLQEILNAIVDALSVISEWADKDSSSSATQLINSILQPSFLVSLHVTTKIFAITLPLSRSLQATNVDLAAALNHVSNAYEELNAIRAAAESEFESLFKIIVEKAAELNTDITIPRLVGKQTHRSNIQASTPEIYYRASVFIPLLDHVLQELNNRFLDHKTILSAFSCLIPTNDQYDLTEEKKNSFRELIKLYESDLQQQDVLSTELQAMSELALWYRDLKKIIHPESPKSSVHYLQLCDKAVYPTIYTLLKTMTTVAVSTSENERSFSNLRRLKTYLRNTTGELRLNGLALLNIYPEILVSSEEVLEKLAEKSRKMNIRLK